jgi:integrase
VEPPVRVDVEPVSSGVVHVLTLHRPDARNAMDTEMLAALLDALDAADRDPATRGVLVTGSNGTFSAGADLHEPMTDAGRRRVALGDAAVAALLEWQIRQAGERQLWGDAYEESGRVFTMANGRALKRQYATRLFDRIREQAKLPKYAANGAKYTFHGQRHQAASLMIADGADLVLVSKRMGHSSLGVTGDLYTHLVHSKEHEAASSYESQVPRGKAGAHTLHAQGGDNEEEAVPAESGNGL